MLIIETATGTLILQRMTEDSYIHHWPNALEPISWWRGRPLGTNCGYELVASKSEKWLVGSWKVSNDDLMIMIKLRPFQGPKIWKERHQTKVGRYKHWSIITHLRYSTQHKSTKLLWKYLNAFAGDLCEQTSNLNYSLNKTIKLQTVRLFREIRL